MIHRLLAALVPLHDRGAVLGDLYEEFPPGSTRMTVRRLLALTGVALRYEVEPYLRGTGGRAAVTLLAAGLGLMCAARSAGASWAGAEIPAGYDPVSGAVLELWASPYALGLLSALAAGLVTGRAGGRGRPGSLDDTPRGHAAIALSVLAALSAPALPVGLVAAGLCLSGAWVGAAARHEGAPPRTRASRASR